MTVMPVMVTPGAGVVAIASVDLGGLLGGNLVEKWVVGCRLHGC